jgi:hypothetical protein
VAEVGRLNACPTWLRKLLIQHGGAGAFACVFACIFGISRLPPGGTGRRGAFQPFSGTRRVRKLGGSTIVARAGGLSWREAAVITPALFTIMVLMAFTTTFMTSPLLTWIDPWRQLEVDQASAEEEQPA